MERDDNSEAVLKFNLICDICAVAIEWPYSIDVVRPSEVSFCGVCRDLVKADDWAALKRRNEAA